MSRFKMLLFASAIVINALGTPAQDLQRCNPIFTGKQVVVKIDMPGTQKGVDLRLQQAYANGLERLLRAHQAIWCGHPSGRRPTGYRRVVKKDIIEFQRDDGGFGTFGDDTNHRYREAIGKK